MQQADSLNFDVLIIGGGPAGLSAAIEIANLNKEKKSNLSVCLLDKGAQIGAHILSGCVLNPCALNQLIPNWKKQNSPIKTQVKNEKFFWFTKKNRYRLPLPPQMNNHNNFMISLSKLCLWLSEYAQNLGVNIISGYAAQKCIFDEKNNCIGITTGEMGKRKDHSKSDQYQPGVNIYARQIIIA